METPIAFIENLSNGIVTEEMLALCLHSVNKRAKNYRDNFNENDYSWKHKEQALSRKRKYYKMKSELLKFILPVSIHCEKQKQKIRISNIDFNTISEYYEQKEKDKDKIIWENSYSINNKTSNSSITNIEFYNIFEETKNYYLYYELYEHSFHEPISEEDLRRYHSLPVIHLSSPLITYGEETKNLLSVTFVKKVLKALQEENAKFTG